MNKKSLIEALKRDSELTPLSDEVIDIIFNNAEIVTYPSKKAIVAEGDIDPSLYITASGLNRIAWFDGVKEITFGFGEEGSMFLSPISFAWGLPAHFSLISVDPCEMLRITKPRLSEMIASSPDFARYFLYVMMVQYAFIELKSHQATVSTKDRYFDMVNRQDHERFMHFRKHYPSILRTVSNQILATYLGITPSSLCNLKKELLEEESKRNKA